MALYSGDTSFALRANRPYASVLVLGEVIVVSARCIAKVRIVLIAYRYVQATACRH